MFYFGYFDGVGIVTLTDQTGENKYYVEYQDYMVQNKAKELGSINDAIRFYLRKREHNWLASYSMSDTFDFPLQYFDIDGYLTPSQYTIDKQCELSGAGDFRFNGKRAHSSSEGKLVDTTYTNIEFNNYLFVHGYELLESMNGYMEKKRGSKTRTIPILRNAGYRRLQIQFGSITINQTKTRLP